MTKQAVCLAGSGAKLARTRGTASVPPLKARAPQVTHTRTGMALHPSDLVSPRWALWWHRTLPGSVSRLPLVTTALCLQSQEAKSPWITITFCATAVSRAYMS